MTFIFLARALRSIVLPLKAVALNLLSVAATYGVTVLIWQKGIGLHALFGLNSNGAVNALAPILLFGFLFGLSMDYEVFILSRMREAYDRTGNTNTARRRRHRPHRRLITSAALILFAALVSLSTAPDLTVKSHRHRPRRRRPHRRHHRSLPTRARTRQPPRQGQLVDATNRSAGAAYPAATSAAHPLHRRPGCRSARTRMTMTPGGRPTALSHLPGRRASPRHARQDQPGAGPRRRGAGPGCRRRAARAAARPPARSARPPAAGSDAAPWRRPRCAASCSRPRAAVVLGPRDRNACRVAVPHQPSGDWPASGRPAPTSPGSSSSACTVAVSAPGSGAQDGAEVVEPFVPYEDSERTETSCSSSGRSASVGSSSSSSSVAGTRAALGPTSRAGRRHSRAHAQCSGALEVAVADAVGEHGEASCPYGRRARRHAARRRRSRRARRPGPGLVQNCPPPRVNEPPSAGADLVAARSRPPQG